MQQQRRSARCMQAQCCASLSRLLLSHQEYRAQPMTTLRRAYLLVAQLM